MKTLKKITVKPITVEYIPDKEFMIQDEIYISVKYKTAVHLCLCGCGELSVTHFMDESGWKITLRAANGQIKGGITFSPSIANDNCPNHYHYVITDNVASVF